MNRRPQILICDDDQMYQLALRQVLKKDFDIQSAFNTDEALAIVKNRKIDLLILDVRMRTSTEGLDAIVKFKALDEELPILMLSGLREFDVVREALKLGATDYICKDVEAEELSHVIAKILERKSLVTRTQQASSAVKREQNRIQLVGKSPAMEQLRKLVEKVRNSNTNVVIFGETGTGKEVLARLIRSELTDGSPVPFIAVDSSTIHSQTAESVLFGHEKGAFTGADRPKKGIFEEANGGVVYFDEIANMPLEIQAKLLRVIQEKEVTRLGSSRSIPLEFRVICATNKKLEDLVKQGLFKEDLYQRLAVIPIQLPPLKARKEDIPELLAYFSKKHATNEKYLNFSDEAIQYLQDYDWPGNVRELSNLVAYLYALCDQDEVTIADLPPKMRDEIRSVTNDVILAPTEEGLSFYDRVARVEAQILRDEYSKCGGNISKLALKLGMDRSHLYTKLRLYSIHVQPQSSGNGKSEAKDYGHVSSAVN